MDRDERMAHRKLMDQLDAADDFSQNLVSIVTMQQELARRSGHPLPTPPPIMTPQGPAMNLQALHILLKEQMDVPSPEPSKSDEGFPGAGSQEPATPTPLSRGEPPEAFVGQGEPDFGAA